MSTGSRPSKKAKAPKVKKTSTTKKTKKAASKKPVKDEKGVSDTSGIIIEAWYDHVEFEEESACHIKQPARDQALLSHAEHHSAD